MVQEDTTMAGKRWADLADPEELPSKSVTGRIARLMLAGIVRAAVSDRR